ncbi:MAG: hypothetical protein QM398_00045 [Thermoproteota archaeon]|nr:hypothetical protein [Thermoproteota archaeon]
MENNDSSEVEDPLPEGYSEALADCHTLAVNLLQRAINGEEINRCWDCPNWCGRYLKGIPNKTACDEACEGFQY